MTPPAEITSPEWARDQDDTDILFHFRERFHIPQHQGADTAYFCGNSLGLQPKSTAWLFQQELEDWAQWGVEGHFQARSPWFAYHKQFSEPLSRVVGARPAEVVAMNTLTVNLHLLLLSFYRPTKERYKIIMEAGAFPSDQYAMESQARLYGLNPDEAIVEIAPRPGAHTLHPDDILAAIAEAGDTLAGVVFGGVNYYTGELFDIRGITEAAHAVGAFAGFDLAHAVGNVPLQLHDWDVDFACWCSYKYLNSGPGGVGGVFVHERHSANPETGRLAGWWGHHEAERFQMRKGFIPEPGAAGWQMSNAPVFNMVGHRASLDLFEKAGMDALREKSLRMTAYLETLLRSLEGAPFEIITPREPHRRGCQLSMLFSERGRETFDAITEKGIIADWREPNVIRVAPVPLYNSFADCYRLYDALKDALA